MGWFQEQERIELIETRAGQRTAREEIADVVANGRADGDETLGIAGHLVARGRARSRKGHGAFALLESC